MQDCRLMSGTYLVLFLLGAQMTCCHLLAERSRLQGRDYIRVPEDIERKKLHERIPSLSTYELLTQYYGFICHQKQPGYYGDPVYDCRIFHVCQPDGRRDTFFCPAWTRFNNDLQICDWQHKVGDFCQSLYNIYGTNHLPDINQKKHQNPAPTESQKQHIPAPVTEEYQEARSQNHPVPDIKYRNKYEEQEYYKSIYEQPNPKLKFRLEDQLPVVLPKQPLKYHSQSVFSHSPPSERKNPPSQPSHQERHVVPEAPPGFRTSLEIPQPPPQSSVPRSAEDDASRGSLDTKSKYETDRSVLFDVPPTTDYTILQKQPNGDGYGSGKSGGNGSGSGNGSGVYGSQGKSAADVASQGGSGYTAEVDYAEMKSLGELYETGPVIELWIPTKVKTLL